MIRFDSIHGTDWVFISPDGKQTKTYLYSGYGATKKDKVDALQFEKDHPDWIKKVESF